MLFKLSLRNARRTIGNYLIYILTVSISIAFIYAISGLVFHPDIQNLSTMSSGLFLLLLGTSCLVVIVIAWLVRYMTKYILERRSKEFGTYMLLGIESRDIARLYRFEQIFLGVLSTCLGLAIGTILLEVIKAIVFRFMDLGYTLTIHFSLKALITTFLSVIAIYFFALIDSGQFFRRQKIVDLMSFDRQNQLLQLKGRRQRLSVFIVSLLFIIVTLFCIEYQFNKYPITVWVVAVSFVILVISIYGVTASLPAMLIKAFLRGNNRYTERVIPVRFFNSKINEISKKLGTLTVIFVVAFSSLMAAMFFSNYYMDQMEELNNYDLMLRWDDMEYVNGVHQIVQQYDIEANASISVYEDEAGSLHDEFKDTNVVAENRREDTIIGLTDYNALRSLAGYPVVSLPEHGFILQTSSTAKDQLKDLIKKDVYEIFGEPMELSAIHSETMNTVDVNFTNYYIVVGDDVLIGKKPVTRVHLWKLRNKNSESLHDDLLAYAKREGKGTRNVQYWDGSQGIDLAHNFSIRGELMEEGKSMMVVLITSLYYIAMIFCAILATILAISMVGDAAKYRYRYDILMKMGYDLSSVDKLILNQILGIFGFPLILGIPVTASITYSVSHIFSGYVSKGFFLKSAGPAVALFFGLYGVYLIITYVSYKRAVKPKLYGKC